MIRTILLVTAFLVVQSSAASTLFVPLGQPGGNQNAVAGLSEDGSTAVGRLFSNEAFVWTLEDGLQLLGGETTSAEDASSDGTTIVGRMDTPQGTRAFKWTSGTGPVPLVSSSFSQATGVSRDGEFIVGQLADQAFLFSAAAGFTGLGDLPGGSFSSIAFDVDDAGEVVVGRSISGVEQEAFKWTSADGIVGLGFLPGGSLSNAQAVSADGSSIVGFSGVDATGTTRPFIWTPASGMVQIGPSNASGATDITADGSVIVGTGAGGWIWSEGEGSRLLSDLLVGDNPVLASWGDLVPRAVSDDGFVVAGWGVNPLGQAEGFVAFLPEPGVLVFIATGGIWLALRRAPWGESRPRRKLGTTDLTQPPMLVWATSALWPRVLLSGARRRALGTHARVTL